MAGTKESSEYRNRCVSPGCSRGANRNGEGRWCWKAKRFSRHSKRALRAYIWRVGWARDSARFPATTNGGCRYEKGGGGTRERCGPVVGCVLARLLAQAVPPCPVLLCTRRCHLATLSPRCPPPPSSSSSPLGPPPANLRFWLSRQYNSKMVAGLRVPLSFLSPVSARPPGYYCTPGATPWTLR